MSFRLLLYEFCNDSGMGLDYSLDVALFHGGWLLDRLFFDETINRPVLANTEDMVKVGIDNLSEEECRMVLIQVCRTKYECLGLVKGTIVAHAGIGVFADELRHLQSSIEEATIYC